MMCDNMPHNPIKGQGQVQGHGGPKVAKMADFKMYLVRWYACNQRLTVNYDKIMSKFDIVDIHHCSASRDLHVL